MTGTSTRPPGRRGLEADVAVVGAGLGGIAAALTIADAGYRVVVSEACDRVGGQVTTQGVAALDEHPLIEHAGRTARYARFRESVRARYRAIGAPEHMSDGRPLDPGDGWVSRLCFEPSVGHQVLATLLEEVGDRLAILLGHAPVAARTGEDRVESVLLRGPGGHEVEVRAAVHLDATELGDLLAVTDAPWTCGAESRDDTGEPNALSGPADPGRMQAATVCAALELRPGEDHTIPRPDGYARLRDTQPFTLELDGGARPFRMFVEGPTGLPPFWTYRRLRNGRVLGGSDVALINWPGNDYRGRGLLGEPPGPDPTAVAEARRLTLAFVHWLQTEVPRDDGTGAGYPELRLAPEVLGTDDGLAAFPYVREARRLRALRRVREQDLLGDAADRSRARPFSDSGGLGWYHLDLHASVGDPTTRWEPTRPFQIPLGALVSRARSNLVAAGKCLGTTHLTNGAYRVHPVEWAAGEAAGALAVGALASHRSPAAVADDEAAVRRTQDRLLRDGAPVFWFDDLPVGHPCWRSAQLLAVAGGLEGDERRLASLHADPRARADDQARRSLTAAAARIVGHPVAPPSTPGATWAEVVMALEPVVDTALASRPAGGAGVTS